MEIKRCPFCGSDETKCVEFFSAVRVVCEKCQTIGPMGCYEEQAAKAWNARSQDIPETVRMLLELQECAYYWSEYDVPLGIKERLDETIRKARGEQ